jgi:beta-N-acetylhexosaminidase
MSDLRQLLGSLVVCGFDDTNLPAEYESLFRQDALGGVILFTRNYENSARLKRLTTAVQTSARGQAIIAVDQEGGRVVRFSGDFPAFPSPHYFGSRNDLPGYLNAVRITAAALREHGVNLNLAPVCDLDPRNESHVLHSRAYSSDPEAVSQFAAAQVQVLRDAHVMSCVKHFPGLGSSTGDPHLQVAETIQSIQEFRDRDYPPFRSAIAAGVDMVMPTHLRAPALDAENIVTFSSKTIQTELRGLLQFGGLVISDDLQMLGALEGIDQAEAGRRALLAGCDLLIYANLEDSLSRLLDQLAQYAREDEGLANRILGSCQRLVAFRNSNPQYFPA